MQIRKRPPPSTFELWASQGSWFWHLTMSDGRAIVGAASSADQAAREACASLGEIEPASCVITMAPVLMESALTWSRVLEGFGRAAVSGRDPNGSQLMLANGRIGFRLWIAG